MLAEAGRGLGLVESLQVPVVAFVQSPSPMHRHPHQIHFVENEPKGAYRPLEHRGVRDVKGESLSAQPRARIPRLLHALRGEIDIDPAREPVLPIPLALPVTEKHQIDHCARTPSARHGVRSGARARRLSPAPRLTCGTFAPAGSGLRRTSEAPDAIPPIGLSQGEHLRFGAGGRYSSQALTVKRSSSDRVPAKRLRRSTLRM